MFSDSVESALSCHTFARRSLPLPLWYGCSFLAVHLHAPNLSLCEGIGSLHAHRYPANNARMRYKPAHSKGFRCGAWAPLSCLRPTVDLPAISQGATTSFAASTGLYSLCQFSPPTSKVQSWRASPVCHRAHFILPYRTVASLPPAKAPLRSG